MAFALELMGGEQVANYYGSWGEWSRKELPEPDRN
jgi:3-mercaptopyruvate sulfurtransferase SseA